MERLGLEEPPTIPCVVRRTSTLLQDLMGRSSPQIDAYHCAEEGFFNNRVDGGGEMEDVARLQHQNDVLLQETMKVSGDYCEEDGVSAIFFNCESTRNMMTGESTGNASSGDSENHGWYKGQKDTSFPERFPTPVVEVGRGTTSSKKMELHVHPSTTGSSTTEAGSFQINFEDYCSGKSKRLRLEKNQKVSSSNIDFRQGRHDGHEADAEAVAHVKEMIYRAAALRPVCLGADTAAEKPRRRNVRISSDPQTVAARHRRERISERLRVLQKLVPGGSKMDTASMLDEAANYLKFLKSQVSALEGLGKTMGSSVTAAATTTSTSFTAPCNDTSTSTTFLPSLSHAIPGPPSLASQTLIQEHHLATRSSWNVTSR